jgi:hypothetical protein
MKKNLLSAITVLAIAGFAQAQTGKVGVNTATPQTTLDVRATNHLGAVTATDGITAPRVNDLATNGTVDGQLVYLIADAGTFSKGFHYWKSDTAVWTPFGGGGSGDPTNDAFVNNSTGTRVELGTKSTGAARDANTEFVVNDSGQIGLGTTAPATGLHLVSDATDTAALRGSITSSKYSVSSGSSISFERNRGSVATPANLVSGDNILSINSKSRIGGALVTSAQIQTRYLGNGTTNASSIFFSNSTGAYIPMGSSAAANTMGINMILNTKGAVSIGGSTNPIHDAVLDLNGHATLSTVTTNRGFMPPRVALTSPTMDLDTDGDTDPLTLPNTTGIMVYNTGTGAVNTKGYYYWNGTEWRILDHSTATAPAVTALNCAGASLSPSSYVSGTPYTGTLLVPYSGGNGGRYTSANTIIANGLSFKLQPGALQYGSGDLVFNVTGTPTVSSPTTTTIPLSSTTVPFYTGTCSAVVGDISYAEIKQTATIGPLLATTNPSAGFHRIITSPDGKFSVRVVIQSGSTLDLADLQIRNNTGSSKTIMWSAHTAYGGGNLGQGGNAGVIPGDGAWYGNGGGNGDLFTTGITNAWADPDVYSGAPETRTYGWTTTDPTDGTHYTMTFMMGAASPTAVANAANAATTKAFLKIEQVKGQ